MKMQAMHEKFKGTGVAIVTPFTDSGEIDWASFEKIIEHIITGGEEYIVLLGTTGESPTVTKQDKTALIAFTAKKINKRVPVVLGVGGNNTADVVFSLKNTDFNEIDAVLSVCPYYNKPQQEGIYQHFKAVADVSPVPVILYTVPGRTGSNISASTTVRLANDFSNIIGIKEASGSFDQIFQVLKNRPEHFLVISGDDGITLPLLSAGADGIISVVANVFPRQFSDMVRFGLAGEFDKARILHYRLLDFMNAIFSDGSPSGIKAALEINGFCRNVLRLPLVPVNNATYSLIKKLITQIKK
jgi:4-hydroxy-tetrahydrodipicolinate synthase